MNARRASARMSGFIAGLGAIATIWPTSAPYRYPHSSSMEALRGDAVRIGSDMRKVIERQNATIKTRKK